MDIIKIMDKAKEIVRLLDEVKLEGDKNMMLSVLCMAVDHCALESGMESVELIDFIRPKIASVNESMGTEGIA